MNRVLFAPQPHSIHPGLTGYRLTHRLASLIHARHPPARLRYSRPMSRPSHTHERRSPEDVFDGALHESDRLLHLLGVDDERRRESEDMTMRHLGQQARVE